MPFNVALGNGSFLAVNFFEEKGCFLITIYVLIYKPFIHFKGILTLLVTMDFLLGSVI